MDSARPQCTATRDVPDRGLARCTLAAGPHDDPDEDVPNPPYDPPLGATWPEWLGP